MLQLCLKSVLIICLFRLAFMKVNSDADPNTGRQQLLLVENVKVVG